MSASDAGGGHRGRVQVVGGASLLAVGARRARPHPREPAPGHRRCSAPRPLPVVDELRDTVEAADDELERLDGLVSHRRSRSPTRSTPPRRLAYSRWRTRSSRRGRRQGTARPPPACAGRRTWARRGEREGALMLKRTFWFAIGPARVRRGVVGPSPVLRTVRALRPEQVQADVAAVGPPARRDLRAAVTEGRAAMRERRPSCGPSSAPARGPPTYRSPGPATVHAFRSPPRRRRGGRAVAAIGPQATHPSVRLNRSHGREPPPSCAAPSPTSSRPGSTPSCRRRA